MTTQILSDLHNTAMGNRNYPSDAGIELPTSPNKSTLLLQLVVAGGVTATIQCTAEDNKRKPQLSADTWLDVTRSCPEHTTGGFAASYVDGNYLVDISHLGGRVRVHEVTSDGSNDSRYTYICRDGGGSPVVRTGAAVKAGSTAVVAADAALAVGIHPSSNFVKPAIYNATTPTLSDTNQTQENVNRRGSVFIAASSRHSRRLDLTVLAAGTGIATSYAKFAEGPCDALRVDTDNIVVYRQPPERALIASQAGADWTGAAGWSRNGNVWSHANGGGTGDLEITPTGISQIGVGETYCVVYTLTWTSGTSLTEKLGTGAGTARSSSATFVKLITAATNGKIIFTPTNDAVCSIDVTSVYVIPPSAPLMSGKYEAESALAVVAIASSATPTTPHTTAKLYGHWLRRAGAVELT